MSPLREKQAGINNSYLDIKLMIVIYSELW